jgi:hypothetical protein
MGRVENEKVAVQVIMFSSSRISAAGSLLVTFVSGSEKAAVGVVVAEEVVLVLLSAHPSMMGVAMVGVAARTRRIEVSFIVMFRGVDVGR